MINQWLMVEAACIRWLRHPQHVLLLALRSTLAWVFFKSGLLKIQSWETTLALFDYEYAVPLLSPYAAAIAGTAAELLLPPLLALGLLTRPVALALFIFNVVAWMSYPDLSPAGVKEHQTWALGFLVLLFAGAGAVSCDYLLRYWRHALTPAGI